MKRKLVLLLVTFAFIFFTVKAVDIMIRYNMDWLEYIKYSRSISYEEKLYIQNEDLVFGTYNDKVPLSFLDDTGLLKGIIMDFISQISIEAETEIKTKAMTENTLKESILIGKIDIATIERNEENEEIYDFTEPLYVLHGKVLVNADSNIEKLSDLKNIKLAVIDEISIINAAESYFNDNQNVKTIHVDDVYQGVELLEKGEVEGLAGDETQISYILNENRGQTDYKFLEYALYRKEVCLAVKKGNTKLISALNKSILSLKQKNLMLQTQSKWFGVFTPSVKDMKSYDYVYIIILFAVAVIAFFVTWNYMTAQKVNEKTRELFESKEELKVIINTLSRGILVINSDMKIIECNDSLLSILKLKREDLIHRNCMYIDELEPFIRLDEDNIHISLGNKYYNIFNKGFENDEKTLITIEDYTDKFVTEQRARQEDKMIAVGHLSAGLAHEIRNPLGLIKSYGYVIKKYCIDDVGNHALNVIYDSVDRISGLIDNLLRFSKLSNEDKKLLDLGKLINSIIELEDKNLKVKDIRVNLNIDSNIKVKTNEDVFKLLLLNLLNNSIDSYENIFRDHKTIEIDIEKAEHEIIIKFSDNGCGIDELSLENIFNPFYTTKESGTGLGLYIISTEIEKMNGIITASSEIGKGTSFHIVIPTGGECDE
ncbi:MAG TPA: transporter substrate-binding domain-containing protein [Anaerovoracaceae bacterium]|nr:transporter substrate-binding domain-containing protein [Anaerovoracaceae bacterium]